MPPKHILPAELTAPDNVNPLTVPQPVTLVTVPPLEGDVLVTVKLG